MCMKGFNQSFLNKSLKCLSQGLSLSTGSLMHPVELFLMIGLFFPLCTCIGRTKRFRYDVMRKSLSY